MKNIKLITVACILSVLFFASCESKSITEEDQEYEILQRNLNYTVGEDAQIDNNDDFDDD